jgi:hypothetical protein
VAHLLPIANHHRIRLKASFHQPLDEPPWLTAGDQKVPGARSDSDGSFWTFDLAGLEPSREYALRLQRASGEELCDAWPLRTFPAPDATPEHFRVLAYTCAGGSESLYNFGFFNAFLPIANRQRMFARALSFAPDAVIANGDHVYWDLKSSRFMGRSPRAWWVAGHFDRSRPVLGTPNERVLKKAFGPQIAGLYGVLFRSTPSFFIQDDHDYGENDEASDELRTFPADPFMIDLGRTTQRLYYPELLADPTLPGSVVSADGVSESFGQLRYGRLFEALLYDCRRFLTNALDPATGDRDSLFVPPSIERWLVKRTTTSDTVHLAHMPSTPVLWSAGKWAEWYPDVTGPEGGLIADGAKPYWPEGWREQHDRLLRAASGRRDRTALFVSGDLHAIGAGRIHATGDRSLDRNPVVSLLTGSVGTGPLGWPSIFRGHRPTPSGTLEVEELISPIEEDGFTILDFSPDRLRVAFFRWTPSLGQQALDHLEPFRELEFPRPGF